MRIPFCILPLLSLATSVCLPARAQGTPPPAVPLGGAAETFIVGQGRPRLLRFPSDITFFSVGPAGALEVRVVNARTLTVAGRREGRAHLTIHFAPRARSKAQEVRRIAVEVRGARQAAEAGGQRHRLSLRVDENSVAVWKVDGLPSLSFGSLDPPVLREWIGSLPEGSVIRWEWPVDLPPNAAPPAAHELRKFAEFCRDEGIQVEGDPLEARQRLEPQLFWEEDLR